VLSHIYCAAIAEGESVKERSGFGLVATPAAAFDALLIAEAGSPGEENE